MGSKEWPPCTPSQENKSTQEGQRKVTKYTKWDQEKAKPKANGGCWVDLHQRKTKGATPTNQEPKQKQNSTKTMDWSKSNTPGIQSNKSKDQNPTKTRSWTQQNQQPDPTKPIAELGKNSSQTQQNQQQNPAGRTGARFSKGDYQPNVDWWVATKGGSQKTTTIPKAQTQ